MYSILFPLNNKQAVNILLEIMIVPSGYLTTDGQLFANFTWMNFEISELFG